MPYHLRTYVPVVILVRNCNINKHHNHSVLMKDQCLLGSRLDQIFSPSVATTFLLFLTIIRDIQLCGNVLHSVHLLLYQQPRKHSVSLALPVKLCQTTAHSSNVNTMSYVNNGTFVILQAVLGIQNQMDSLNAKCNTSNLSRNVSHHLVIFISPC